MTDTAFSDSYIETDAELETLIGSDPRTAAVALKAASADTQKWYCQAATKAINRLPLRGRKYARDGTQDLQFPREYMTPDGWFPDNDEEGTVAVPQAVIDACLEEAIALYAHYSSSDAQSRADLQDQGVKAYSLGGGYSETFGPSGAKHGLKSSTAYDLLARYILRSAPIV